MKKNLCIAVVAAMAVLTTGMTAFAGEWKTDANGKWYQNDDGSYPVSQSVEIDGVNYQFDENGYLVKSTAQVGSGFVDILHAGMSNEETDNVMRAALKEYWSSRPNLVGEACYDDGHFLYRDYNGIFPTPSYAGMNILDEGVPFVARIALGGQWSDEAKYGDKFYLSVPETVKGTLYRTIGVAETERIWPALVADADRTIEGYARLTDENGNYIPDPERGAGQYLGKIVSDAGDGLQLTQDFEGTTASGHHYKIFKEETGIGDGMVAGRNHIIIYKN